jgi:hypothetical protein
VHAFYWLPTNHDVRNFNKHAAVELSRFAGKGISGTDLAEQMGLTKAAVTIIVNDLVANNMIVETESNIPFREHLMWPRLPAQATSLHKNHQALRSIYWNGDCRLNQSL